MIQKIPPEVMTKFQKTGVIISEIYIQPLKTFKVVVKGDLIFLDNGS